MNQRPDPIDATAAEEVIRALLTVAVHPVWRDAVEVVSEYNRIQQDRFDLDRRRVSAYEDRTHLLRDEVVPKLVPVAVALLTVLVGGLAVSWGVPVP